MFINLHHETAARHNYGSLSHLQYGCVCVCVRACARVCARVCACVCVCDLYEI